MATIPQVAAAMRGVLTTDADALARQVGFVRRRRKVSGGTFAQALVFSWRADPQATVEARAQTAALRGLASSAQGLEQRCDERAASFPQRLLEAAVQTLVAADPVAVPLLRRFAGVYVYDGSVLALPDALRGAWPGCGGSVPSGAALQLGVRLELLGGGLHGPVLAPGRVNDGALPLDPAAPPAGALRLSDRGFFDLARFRALDERGAYWLSHLLAGTAVYDEAGARHDLLRLLAERAAPTLDLPVRLGAAARLPARLLAYRAPQGVADERRRKLRDEARRRQRPVSRERLALADWTIVVTNVPPRLLTPDEALVLLRARWQVEQLFHLWKTHGGVDRSRSAKPWRVRCEVCAKLLALLLQHWVFLACCWQFPDRSLIKAAQTVRRHAVALAGALDALARLAAALGALARCLARGCRINKRRTKRHTYQQLLACTAGAAR